MSAVESLIERGETHAVYCERCGRECRHDAPGATEQFRNFFETHAPGTPVKTRNEMYSLRSDILHGTTVMHLDRGTAFGWDPPVQRERDLYDQLWDLARVAIRSWSQTAKATR